MEVVPAELIESVITAALEKARAEKHVRQDVERGMSATAAFAKYGIL
jgi:regulator of RNase E activity RraA